VLFYILCLSPPLIASHRRQGPSDEHIPSPESKTNLGNRRARPTISTKCSLPSLPSVPSSILGPVQHLRWVTTLTIIGSPHALPCSRQQTLDHLLGHHSYYHWALLPNARSRTPKFWKHNEELSRTISYASQDDTFINTTCVHCFALYASLSLVFRARHCYSSSILYIYVLFIPTV